MSGTTAITTTVTGDNSAHRLPVACELANRLWFD